jgi:predicted site-specific integrase-resolvase
MANRNQIKELQVTAPRGAPLDSQKLESLGVSRALAHEYVKAGWLEKLGRGVFMFAGDQLAQDCGRRRERRMIWAV